MIGVDMESLYGSIAKCMCQLGSESSDSSAVWGNSSE